MLAELKSVKGPRHRGRRFALGLTALLVVSALLVSLGTAWSVIAAVSPRTSIGNLSDLLPGRSSDRGSVRWMLQHGRRVNLLLLGRGGGGEENPDFTDTILILSLRPSNPVATLISLPRFLEVDEPAPVVGSVRAELYTVFALGRTSNPALRSMWRSPTGGGDLAAATVSGLVGEPIDGFIAIDLDAFRRIVDAVGGIRLSVPVPLSDPRYPVGESRETKLVHFDAGTQWLTGEQAEEYARSRLSTSESDRTNRQALVLAALWERIRQVGVSPKLLQLFLACRSGVLTSLRAADMLQLFTAIRGRPPSMLHRLAIDSSNVLYQPRGDQHTLLPRDPTLVQLRTLVAAALP